jgi:hypothetical protein
MKLESLLCILPVLAGFALTGCEVPAVATTSTYVDTAPVSTSMVLTYGNGWSGPGYYYGPPGLSYYRRGPGVYYYHSREVVPHAYWNHWHGDRRYYWEGHGGHDHDHDGVRNKWDRRPNDYRRY